VCAESFYKATGFWGPRKLARNFEDHVEATWGWSTHGSAAGQRRKSLMQRLTGCVVEAVEGQVACSIPPTQGIVSTAAEVRVDLPSSVVKLLRRWVVDRGKVRH
jgi:hypothetical protein